MFCNINPREIKRTISKENIWTNDIPLEFSYLILYSYSEISVSRWNDKQNLSVGRWVGGALVGGSVVGGSVEDLPVGRWSVVGGR